MWWTRKAPEITVKVVVEREPDKPAETKPEPKNKPLWGQLSEEIEKDKPRWTYLVPPIATLLGTLGTIIILAVTLNLNNDNNSKVLKETQEKNRVERKENAIRRLETEFSEVQTRLSNSDPQTRAVAVLQLADLAQTSLPAEALTPEEDKAGYKITDFSRTHYPFFLRAVRQYATTLPMEKDASVRAATKDAVALLMKFLRKYMTLPKTPASPNASAQPVSSSPTEAKALPAPEPEYPKASYEIKDAVQGKEKVEEKTTRVEYRITEVDVVLAEMTNELADANRKAKNNFMRAYANYSVKINPKTKQSVIYSMKIDPKTKKSVIYDNDLMMATTNFCNDEEATKAALKVLRQTLLFSTQQKIYQEQRNAPNPTKEQQAKGAALLDTLEQEAQKLVDTRDALTTTLLEITLPPGFPTTEMASDISEIEKVKTKILAQEMTNSEAKNEATDKFRRARERIYTLTERWQRNPALDLSNCFFVGADLRGAQLQGAYLFGAQLQGAELSEAQFDSKTCLYAISVQPQDGSAQGGYQQTNFSNSNWQEANFNLRKYWGKSPENDEHTKNVKAWLKEAFPYEAKR